MRGDHFQVLRLTQEAYDQLSLFAREEPQAYLNPDTDFEAVLFNRGVSDYCEETGIFANRPISLSPMSSISLSPLYTRNDPKCCH